MLGGGKKKKGILGWLWNVIESGRNAVILPTSRKVSFGGTKEVAQHQK